MDDSISDSSNHQSGGCESQLCDAEEEIPSLRDRVWGADCGGSEGRPLMGMVCGEVRELDIG